MYHLLTTLPNQARIKYSDTTSCILFYFKRQLWSRIFYKVSQTIKKVLSNCINLYYELFYIITVCTLVWDKGDLRLYEGWNFNSGNYLFTTDIK